MKLLQARLLVLASIVLILIGCPLFAQQELSKAEVLGGFSFSRNENGRNAVGLMGDLSFNFTEKIGIAVNFGAYMGVGEGPDLGLYEYMLGPRYTVRKDKYEVFVHALFGGATVNTNSYDSDVSFAFGGGLNLPINDRLKFRAVQFDYVPMRFNGSFWDSYRLTTGIVFNIGKQK